MDKIEVESIDDLKNFIKKEGLESDILENKDYYAVTNWEEKKYDIIKAICGLANNKGGFFVIGVDDSGDVVYTNIISQIFMDKLRGWVNSHIEPKGISYRPKEIKDENGYCIAIEVETTPGTCYAQKIKNDYKFPYRAYGETVYYSYEDFFKIYIHKFLRDIAISGEILKGKKKFPYKVSRIPDSEEKINLEIIKNYTSMLKTTKFSKFNLTSIFQKLRIEFLKVSRKKELNDEIIKISTDFVTFCSHYIKEQDEEVFNAILNIFYLLTLNSQTLDIVCKNFYDYSIKIYENGKNNDDLIKILDACGYFDEKISWIMKSIEKRDDLLLNILISNLDISKIENKYDFNRKLRLNLEKLDLKEDKKIKDLIDDLLRNLENI